MNDTDSKLHDSMLTCMCCQGQRHVTLSLSLLPTKPKHTHATICNKPLNLLVYNAAHRSRCFSTTEHSPAFGYSRCRTYRVIITYSYVCNAELIYSLRLARPGVLIRDVWNSDLTTLLPKSESYPNLAQWQVVPQVYDDLCAWALVERSDEERGTFRPFMLLYHPDIYPSSSAPTIVSMRFHGVVESLNISPVGNYTGWVLYLYNILWYANN